MYRLTVVYDFPPDEEKFLKHYREVHAVLATKLPKLVAFDWGVCESPDGAKPPFFLVATLDWASKEDALAALGSPAGKEANADLANFASPDGFKMTFAEITKAR